MCHAVELKKLFPVVETKVFSLQEARTILDGNLLPNGHPMELPAGRPPTKLPIIVDPKRKKETPALV